MQTGKVFTANSRSCPNCGGTKIRHATYSAYDTPGRRGIVRLRICAMCRLAWQWPPGRNLQESRDWFSAQYRAQETGTYFDPNRQREVAALKTEFVRTLVKSPTSLLDIGAGSGTFVRAAAEAGWQATGIDPSLPDDVSGQPAGSGTCRLLAGTIDSLKADEMFDIVTLWDVIEHVEEPMRLLRSAASHLSANGNLVVETGNYLSRDRADQADQWWGYQLEHRWYFSPRTLEPLLERAGFRSFRYSMRALEPGWKASSEYRGPSRLHLLQSVLRRPWQAVKAVRRFLELKRVSKVPLHEISIFTVAASRRAVSSREPGPR